MKVIVNKSSNFSSGLLGQIYVKMLRGVTYTINKHYIKTKEKRKDSTLTKNSYATHADTIGVPLCSIATIFGMLS